MPVSDRAGAEESPRHQPLSERPVLMLSETRVRELLDRSSHDPVLGGWIDRVTSSARDELAGEPLPMRWYGEGVFRHMLETSRLALRRATTTALAWRLGGGDVFVDRLAEVLDACAALPDWYPQHFLDTAEMMTAVALGLAWGWDGLPDDVRQRAMQALLDHGIRPALAAHQPGWPFHPWPEGRSNWNVVCNGGTVLAALAVRRADPELAELAISTARRSLHSGLAAFVPQGAYPEGTVYWGYATRYLAKLVGSLQSDLGTDLGILDAPGIDRTAAYPLLVRSPTGHTVAFGDQIWTSTSSHRAWSMFFFAHAFDRPEFAHAEHEHLHQSPHMITPMHVVWYTPNVYRPVEVPRATLLEGITPLTVMRTQGEGKRGAFLSVKGGSNPANHGNLDLGAFEYHALGQRWVIDLGRDDYRLPGYWEEIDPADAARPGARYRVFRCSSFSHSVPIIDGEQQVIVGESRFLEFDPDGPVPRCVIELTDAYRGRVRSLVRHAELDLDSGVTVIEDRFEVDEPRAIDWAFLTPAHIEIISERTVQLTLDGECVELGLVLPPGARIGVESAEQPAPEERNEGVSRLSIRFNAAPGESIVVAKFCPVGLHQGTDRSKHSIRSRPVAPETPSPTQR
ncbi:MAG: heparinase II/III family protein [Planctomycetota bacterium]